MSFDAQEFHRFTRDLKINTKEFGMRSLGDNPFRAQNILMEQIEDGFNHDVREFVTLKCLAPDTLVLCADLRWRQIQSLDIGDELVAFDENTMLETGAKAHTRKMRTTTVKAKWKSRKTALKVSTEGGLSFTASYDHRVLCRRRGGKDTVWRRIKDLAVGDEIKYVCEPWADSDDKEDGWFAGMMDGEGCLRTARSGTELTVSQVDGPVFDRVLRYVCAKGYTFKVERDSRKPGPGSKLGSKVVNKIRMSRTAEIMKILGVCRPSRWEHLRLWEGKDLPGKRIGDGTRKVVSIEFVGEKDLIDIETGTKTFIAAGFCQHNCRQIGISTITLALDLYFINKFTGTNAALVTHTGSARDKFRTILELYRAGLAEEWQRDVMDDNRNQLVLNNGSVLSYEVAGIKQKSGESTLGRSGALSLCHATEVAYYAPNCGIESLKSSFAKHNPNRFYHFESTANGFNDFERMWQEAKTSSTKRCIFITWWMHDLYALAPDTELYRRYAGRLTGDERAMTREVLKRYGHEIEQSQWAWYRYMQAEEVTDEAKMSADYPHTEDMAFVATGTTFFRNLSITQALKQCREIKTAQYYRIETGREFWNTRIVDSRATHATLKIWAEPVQGAEYVLGCDPSFGSSDTADNNVIEVYRVWYNRIEQVAEYADPTISTHACAWIFAYLAGYYGKTTTNLEVNGPGQQVLAELQNLRRQASSHLSEAPGVRQVLKYMRQYLYRKIDTFNKPSAIHTKTNHDIKERLMNAERDYFERGIMVVRSVDLVDEMRDIVRDGGSAPQARAGKHDDRVMASGLAVMCWDDQMRARLLASKILWDQDETTGEPIEGPRNPVEKLARSYFTSIGFGPASDVPPPKKVAYRGRETWREKVAQARAKGL